MAITLLLSTVAFAPTALADDNGAALQPNRLLVSRSVYDVHPNIVPGVTQLPPNCVAPNCVTATANGAYPTVFNNVLPDPSFGVTTKIFLDELTRGGEVVRSLEVPNSAQRNMGPNSDQMVTSFSSKSEIALNLSTDGQFVSFMGYLAPAGAVDVSNSNTPFVIDPTDPVPGQDYRVVAQVDARGHFRFTKTNAYSGNNGRAAIINNSNGVNVAYLTGNAGNGNDPQPDGVIVGGGAQILTPQNRPLSRQVDPGLPTPLGSFNILQVPGTKKTDKIGKDTNFRGLTIFNNVVYVTKGSGSNGVNTLYFVDTSGFDAQQRPLACPNGTGVPKPLVTLPTAPISFNAANLQTQGVFPYNMCILNGFPTATKSKTAFPFGVWFANATTVYVADEGNGSTTFNAASGTFTDAAAQTTAGLQKWIFDTTAGAWKLAYVLSAGLDLGVPYTIENYPTGNNAATGLPWSPATDGLRNITGRVHRDGTVTIWAITSTVSGNGDQGADPNKLVAITDTVAATTLPARERFRTVRTARFGEVLRGVSFTPGTNLARRDNDDDDRGDVGHGDGGHGNDGQGHGH
ncbi:MAG TPA: hypothetical protein VGG01_24670 [Xanthobacteraceae bacterium]